MNSDFLKKSMRWNFITAKSKIHEMHESTQTRYAQQHQTRDTRSYPNMYTNTARMLIKPTPLISKKERRSARKRNKLIKANESASKPLLQEGFLHTQLRAKSHGKHGPNLTLVRHGKIQSETHGNRRPEDSPSQIEKLHKHHQQTKAN